MKELENLLKKLRRSRPPLNMNYLVQLNELLSLRAIWKRSSLTQRLIICNMEKLNGREELAEDIEIFSGNTIVSDAP